MVKLWLLNTIFTWEIWLKDDILLFDYNVQERVNDFVAAALAQVVPILILIKTLIFGFLCIKYCTLFERYNKPMYFYLPGFLVDC
jgi:hypothetical protein